MFRPILLGGGSLAALFAVAAQAAPLRTSVTAGSPVPAWVQLIHEGHAGAAQASGTVNAVDTAHHTVNLSHGSIKALGWPAMTIDFPASPDVDLATLKPGMRVNFTLVHGNSGMVVDSIRPLAGREQ